MRLKELIDNPEFSFCPEFRLGSYNYDTDKVKVLFDSRKTKKDYTEFKDWWIVAINQDEDGTIMIEIDNFA